MHPDASFIRGDIRDRAFIDSVFEKKILMESFFAANSQVGEYGKSHSNITITTFVEQKYCWKYGCITLNKIVFSSTAATYGEPERIPILETDRTVPTNCYGETKLSMEKDV